MQCSVLLIPLILALVNASDSPVKGRIVGGRVVNIEEFPYQVSVRFNGRHICGGSIISPDTILTAAHCTVGGNAQQFNVRSGSDSADLGTLHTVYRIERHPRYNEITKSYDAAKFKITPPITYSSRSQPIRLASQRPADNTPLVISGWGKRNENEGPSLAATRNLRAVIVPVISQRACSRRYQNLEVSDVMICASSRGMDSCQGDSGGPLVNTLTGEQVGISSWGIGCARQNYPGVYGSVPDLLDFILS